MQNVATFMGNWRALRPCQDGADSRELLFTLGIGFGIDEWMDKRLDGLNWKTNDIQTYWADLL